MPSKALTPLTDKELKQATCKAKTNRIYDVFIVGLLIEIAIYSSMNYGFGLLTFLHNDSFTDKQVLWVYNISTSPCRYRPSPITQTTASKSSCCGSRISSKFRRMRARGSKGASPSGFGV